MKNLLLYLLLFSFTLTAQEKPTLYLIGDSTMSDKKDPDRNPEHGWGQMLPILMSSGINIENHAVNGRSTRSFIAEERWEKVKEKLAPGDYVFIQFGHNDQKFKDPTRYTNPFTQYRANLEKFVKETREKGATPFLLSSIVRRNFNDQGVLVDTHGEYPLVTRMVAKDMGVPFIDLQLLTEQLEICYGPENSKELHLHLEPGQNAYEPKGITDNTHLSKNGAIAVASLALKEIAKNDFPLKKYIKNEVVASKIIKCTSAESKENLKVNWRRALDQDKQWYASREAQRIADNVLIYQHNNGGWYKNIAMADKLSAIEKDSLRKIQSSKLGTTIDNRATYTQLRYLARVYHATGKEKYKKAFLRGVDFLLEAQYKNGGWPQFYPIKKGYYEHITFNDGAMIGVMKLLRNIAQSKEPYTFVEAVRREKAQKAIDKGLDVILDAQVKVDGKLTIWSAQHHKKDLSPAQARSYELPSLSGKESVDIVKYLMALERPSEEVKRSVRTAVQWFEDHKVMDKKVVWIENDKLPNGRDRIIVKDPSGGPLWGRFNDIETGEPIFVGRDGIIKKRFADIEQERRVGYNYIDNYAEDLLEEHYPAWEKRMKTKE